MLSEMFHVHWDMFNLGLMPVLGFSPDGYVENKTSSAKFSADTFFNSLADNSLGWAYAIIGILGVLAICGGAYLLVTGLMSRGRKQTNWPMVIGVLLIGGIMTFGGWSMFAGTLAAGATHTVSGWGA